MFGVGRRPYGYGFRPGFGRRFGGYGGGFFLPFTLGAVTGAALSPYRPYYPYNPYYSYPPYYY